MPDSLLFSLIAILLLEFIGGQVVRRIVAPPILGMILYQVRVIALNTICIHEIIKTGSIKLAICTRWSVSSSRSDVGVLQNALLATLPT